VGQIEEHIVGMQQMQLSAYLSLLPLDRRQALFLGRDQIQDPEEELHLVVTNNLGTFALQHDARRLLRCLRHYQIHDDRHLVHLELQALQKLMGVEVKAWLMK